MDDPGRVVFVIVMFVIAAVYAAIMIPQMIKTKRRMNEAEIEFRRTMAEYDRWMRR